MTARLLALLAALALGAWTARPRDGGGVVVAGDGAPAVAAALDGAALDRGGAAARRLVLLRRWQSLDHLPAMRRLCRGACGDGGPAAVELRIPALAGRRLVTLVNLAALGAGPALDRGDPPPEPALGCLREIVAGAAETLCGTTRTVAWRLPRGL